MKYTAKISQVQSVGKVKIDPEGGTFTDDQVAEIKKDPWGKELIRTGILQIEGVKPGDIVDEPKKGSKKQDSPKVENSLDKMTKEQLVAYAAEKKIAVSDKETAEKILATIKEAEAKK